MSQPMQPYPPVQGPPPGWQVPPQYAPQPPFPGQPTSGGQPGMPPGSPPPISGSGSGGTRTTLLKGLVVGVLVAAAVAAALVVTGVMHFGDKTAVAAKVDTTAIELPARLGGLQDRVAAIKVKGGDTRAAKEQDLVDKEAAATVAAYQQAYGGAASAVRLYSDTALVHFATVIAVRASSPGLTNGLVPDLDNLGLAVAPTAVQQFGEVSCLVQQLETVVAGKAVDPDNSAYVLCERSGPRLTIIVSGSGFKGDGDKDVITKLVNDAFDKVSAA